METSSNTTHGIDELDQARIELETQNYTEPDNVSSLLPADGGKDAWLFLVGSFVQETIVWGFALGFGVLNEYYATHPPFAGSHNIATIGTTASGLMYLSIPLNFLFLMRFPNLRSWFQFMGLTIFVAGILGSSFATTTDQLIGMQGVIYAIGGTMLNAPTLIYLDEWFIQKKGFAFGIVWSGVGFAGVTVPVLLQLALDTFGYRTTIQGWSVIVLVTIAPTLHLIKPRLPQQRKRNFNLRFLLNPQFIIFELSNILQATAYFIPAVYLPRFARALGATNKVASLTLVAFNSTAVLSNLIIGRQVDRWHVTSATTISLLGSATAVLALWGLSMNTMVLFVFSIVYGLFAGGWSSTWSGIMKLVCGKVVRTEATLVFGFLAAGRGIGNIVSGPISELLLGKSEVRSGYEGAYKYIVIFTGVTLFCSSFTLLGRLRPGFM